MDREIDTKVPPSGNGCQECLASGGWWLHLRRCAICGHVGCCDSSPSQHARKHATDHRHAIMASFEPGEEWFYDYETEDYLETNAQLCPPRWHPKGQPAPGPAGKVPHDWESRLNQ
jgi:hypothetical protein